VSGLVELERYWTWIESEVVRSMLLSHGIHAVVFDGGLNSAEGGGLGMQTRVMVLDEDYEEALRLLREGARPGRG
jgi:hypothetical protein